jgi:hypothetical protein
MLGALIDSTHFQLPHLATKIGALGRSEAIVCRQGTLCLVDFDCCQEYYERSCYTKAPTAEIMLTIATVALCSS